MKYKLSNGLPIIRLHDSGFEDVIQADPDTVDYQTYLDWLELGNIPEPADVVSTIQSKIEALWQAADAYVSSYISGVAIGLLTIGVIKQTPKALAITAWSNSIWTAYYDRKAAVTEDTDPDLDFLSFGDIPHSVPELQAEVLA